MIGRVRPDADAVELGIASAVPLFAVDGDQTIVAWNRGAEALTGIAADTAMGQSCWTVLAGRYDSGGLACHWLCSSFRQARAGWAVETETMNVEGPDGRRRLAVDTVALRGNGPSLFLHLLAAAPPEAATRDESLVLLGPAPRLTPRQLEVVQLLSQGKPVRTIALQLGLAEATVRNHVRAVLIELGAHSQLEAVFVARGHGLV